MFDALARRPAALRGLVRSGNSVLATTDRMRTGLRRTIDALVPLQHELRTSTGSALADARAYGAPPRRVVKTVAVRTNGELRVVALHVVQQRSGRNVAAAGGVEPRRIQVGDAALVEHVNRVLRLVERRL